MLQHPEQVEVSLDGKTVWVHAMDGSTVGRFSRVFGMDVHRQISEQLAGVSQCLHCTHVTPNADDWTMFCALMLEHFGIHVDPGLMNFESA